MERRGWSQEPTHKAESIGPNNHVVVENEEEIKGKNDCKKASLKNQMASDAINQ